MTLEFVNLAVGRLHDVGELLHRVRGCSRSARDPRHGRFCCRDLPHRLVIQRVELFELPPVPLLPFHQLPHRLVELLEIVAELLRQVPVEVDDDHF